MGLLNLEEQMLRSGLLNKKPKGVLEHIGAYGQIDPKLAYQMLAKPDPTREEPGLGGPMFDPTIDLLPFGKMAKLAEMGLGKMGLLGAIAYHGSPHKFSKFSMKNVGTGEGAQAYGHGLYFAENPGVANQYKKSLENPGDVLYLSSKYHAEKIPLAQVRPGWAQPDHEKWMAANLVAKSGGDIDKAITKAGESINKNTVLPVLQKWKESGTKFKIEGAKLGATYKVDIPDSAVNKMLDWDKPLSQQPEIFKNLKSGNWIGEGDGAITGGEFIQGLSPETQMKIAKEYGIPGIKYLDQGSRQAGKGTRNFVLFDEDLAKIIGRE